MKNCMKFVRGAILRRLAMLAIMMQAFLVASAYDFEVDGIYYNVVSLPDLTCEVTRVGNKNVEDIVIPSIVEYNSCKLAVVKIGDWAFKSCEGLTSVEFPSSLTSIGASAFSGCWSLTSVKFPSSLTLIGASAFSGCSRLTSVEFPSSLTSIGASAFENCESLTSVEFPSSLTSIGESAFQSCKSLTSVEFPASLTLIGASAFCGCSSLTSVEFSEGLTTIGYKAFAGCSSLTSAKFPSSLTLIGESAFENCSGLTSVELSEGLTTIENRTFFRCKSLTSVEFPSSLISIGESAFDGCYRLTSVEFPASLTSIGEYAFCNCSNLTSVEFSEGLTTIGHDAFYSCSSLTSLEFPASLISIGDNAFYRCYRLTSVEFPSSLTSIGAYAFQSCWSLTSVEFPASLTSIGEYAFCKCSGLSYVKFEETTQLVNLDRCVFDETSLEHVILPILCKMKARDEAGNCFYNNIKYLKVGSLGCYSSYIYNYQLNLSKRIKTMEIDNAVWGNHRFVPCKVENLILSEKYRAEKPDQFGFSGDYSLEFDFSELKKLVSKTLEPPVIPGEVPTKILMDAEVEVPIQALEKYQRAPVWKDFWNLKGVDGLVSIEEMEVVAAEEVGRYDLTGKAVAEDYRGIVIVRYSDGTTSKTLQR